MQRQSTIPKMISCRWTAVFLLATCLQAALLPVDVIGNVQGVAFENLAVRYTQQVLATTAFPQADVYLFDPMGLDPVQPLLVASLPGASGSYGITELGNNRERDIFYVLGGNFSLTTFAAVPNSFNLYEVNMRGFRAFKNGTIEHRPQVTLVTSLNATTQPNGMTRFGESILLVADSAQGAVWSIDLTDRQRVSVSKVIQHPSMAENTTASAFSKLGINGLRASENQLFYCNAAFHTIYSLDLKTMPGQNVPVPLGSPRKVAEKCICDDFAVDMDLGMLFVASPADAVVAVDIASGEQMILAGIFGNLTGGIPGASSAQVGDCGRSLYVTTNANGNATASQGLQGLRKLDLLPLMTGTYRRR